jgi:outer membrane receptor protein involved in Fe transport
MVRKHADSNEFKVTSASYGSWDKQRYVLDLQAPLVESGKVRGRLITGYQDNDSFVDNYHYRKKFLRCGGCRCDRQHHPLWDMNTRKARPKILPGAVCRLVQRRQQNALRS